jgi:5-dehydro-2-deoxygluconokinase
VETIQLAATCEALELVCIGRTCVDLYGEQVGAPLESMQSFRMYVGGSASNVCIGAARLGIRTAMIARVGNDALGRFVQKTFVDEKVDVSGTRFDPDRLTGLITLAVRKCDDFPRIFYYENAADLALSEDDINEDLVGSAKVLLVTGTHFSRPNLDAASRKAIRVAKANNRRIVFDIDYRPVLWGLTSHGRGEQMFVESGRVSDHLQSILPDCDLIVGTEEELCIAGGTTDLYGALQAIRSRTGAAVIRKRGAQGSMVYAGEIPRDLDSGLSAATFPVEVLNSTGAGDAFLAGFLYGWIRGEHLETCCRFANACGAIVVSRHGCSAAMPSIRELNYFLSSAPRSTRLWEDSKLEHLYRVTQRGSDWPKLAILAFDHRHQFKEMATRLGRDESQICVAKQLIAQAWQSVAERRPYVGVIIDEQYGADLLEQLTGRERWIARPIEQANVTPLEFVGGANVGLTLRSWPREHIVKCLIRYECGGDGQRNATQDAQLLRLFNACRSLERKLVLEVLPNQVARCADFEIATVMRHFYDIGVYPDWWKVESPPRETEWQAITNTIASNDPECCGVILLGKGVPLDELRRSFAIARTHSVCRGFAVGRSIFHEPIQSWFEDRCSDDDCIQIIEANFLDLINTWEGSP